MELSWCLWVEVSHELLRCWLGLEFHLKASLVLVGKSASMLTHMAVGRDQSPTRDLCLRTTSWNGDRHCRASQPRQSQAGAQLRCHSPFKTQCWKCHPFCHISCQNWVKMSSTCSREGGYTSTWISRDQWGPSQRLPTINIYTEKYAEHKPSWSSLY